jgi:hypothetical protein
MESIMKNVGMCLDLGENGTATAYGEWDLERKQSFIQSILGGVGMNAIVREDGGFGGVRRMCAECCMCGATYEGYGHNAQPIYDARCCDDCNALVIIGRLNLCEKGDDIYEHIHKTIEKFPSQKHFIWTALKKKVKSFSKRGGSGATLDFNPVKVVAEANKKRQRDEAERLRRQKECEERTAKLREERERLERIEAERKAQDEEDKKKREEDFERRLKALEIKEQERKEEEKREKERKAKEAEARKAKKEAEKAEKQKKFEGKRK